MDFLINNYSVENIVISKPRKKNNILVSKVKYSDYNDLVIQLPKMQVGSKNEEILVLKNDSKNSEYSKKFNEFNNKLYTHLIEKINKYSEEWFGKNISVENLKKMFVVDNNISINITKEVEYYSHKNELISELSELSFLENEIVECICKVNCLLFEKESCKLLYDLISCKFHKKRINRVKPYGFIEEENNQVSFF